MCDRIPKTYAIQIGAKYAYVSNDGMLGVSPIISAVWDIFPMPDNQRPTNEREASIGTRYQKRPYNATISGKLWTEGMSPNGDIIKIYFRSFESDGLPSPSNTMSIPMVGYPEGLPIYVAGVTMFGLSYNDRMFGCMLRVCNTEETVDDNGLPSIRCRDFFVNQVDDSTQDQIAINKFCNRSNPDGMCPDLCSKNRDTAEQCQSIYYTRCSNERYARDNPDICGCYMPVSVYTDYLNRMRRTINSLDDRYAALKSILSIVDYDPANPQCFYPSCITARYKNIHGDTTTCPDFTVCFQGIDLSADVINDTQLNLLNDCLIERGINPPTIDPGPSPTPTPTPRPPTNGTSGKNKGTSKNKNSTITWIAIGGGILLLIVIIAVTVGIGKKK